jgi:hypothetical protein
VKDIDIERLLDNAATASQVIELLRDDDGEETSLREAVRINVVEPLLRSSEAYDEAALYEASVAVHMHLLREGSSWGTKACEEMGSNFMTANRKAAMSSQSDTEESK